MGGIMGSGSPGAHVWGSSWEGRPEAHGVGSTGSRRRWPSRGLAGKGRAAGVKDSTTHHAFTLSQADAKGSVRMISTSNPTNPAAPAQSSQPFHKELQDLETCEKRVLECSQIPRNYVIFEILHLSFKVLKNIQEKPDREQNAL